MTTNLVKIFHDTIACARFNKLATLNEVNVLLVNYTPITVVDILCVTEYIYKDIMLLHVDNNIVRI